MIKSIFNVLTIAILAIGMTALISSCSENESFEEEISVENYVNHSVDYLHAEGNCGRLGCYEFVFPISIVFPYGESVVVDDYQSLRAELKEWFEIHGDNIDWPERNDSLTMDDIPFDQLPTLGFPLEVISEEGEMITVNSREELRELRRECRRDILRQIRRHHRNHHRDICFKLVFPVTLDFPDGTTFSAESRQALKGAIREWRANNPDVDERPQLSFPVTIEFEDGTTQQVDSKESLAEIKESCSQD